ncbi:MAG: ACP synthase [Myxococcaceae bacterium]|nr:ACP synthase [Myxococcaceae bacterium]
MSAAEVKHPGSLTLRRLRAGEALDGGVQAHVAGCSVCQATLAALAEEQGQFEREISFDRFAAGVERAARQAQRPAPTRRWAAPVLALAAGLTVVAGVQLVLARVEPELAGGNRTKGGASVEVRVAGGGAQRTASAEPSVPEALAPGERVRLGLVASEWKYGLVVSIDDAGEITPIYVDNGHSLSLPGGAETTWLPDSLEFTGRGLERVVVVLSASPLSIDQVSAPLRLAWQDARGDLTKLGTLPLPGEQFHRTFLKP